MASSRSRALHRMSAREFETLSAPGAYPDGGGLYLRISGTGNRKWELRYTSPLTGKRVAMGLGSANKGHVSLAAARTAAKTVRESVQAGVDPAAERVKDRGAKSAQHAPESPTFGEFALDWLDRNEAQFRNIKHRAQWRSTLTTYANSIWTADPKAIATKDILQILQPIWASRPETAKRVQGRLERLLDAAKAVGLASGDNPARWRGHLALLLPKRTRATHHPALPYDRAGEFMRALRNQRGVAARALEFLILTAARSGEVRGMRWSELSSDGTVWTVPAERMKAGRQHRVPLSSSAQLIVAEMRALRNMDEGDGALVFPGARAEKPMSDMTLSAVIKRMRANKEMGALLRDSAGSEIVVHGFRSTFRDWAEDAARFPARVVEAALAHTIKDKAEAAYRRGDALESRIELMSAWDAYLNGSAKGVLARKA